MVAEAKLVETELGLVPDGEGWFVVNAREAAWGEKGDVFGRAARFENDVEFSEIGVNIRVLERGQPNCYYHGEAQQEAILVLSGECLLLVEGEERSLSAWDFVHLPPWTEHVLVGAGDRPCVVVMVGGRFDLDRVSYPVSELALRHGAGVERTTDSPAEAYAATPERRARRYREGDLP
jgi:uncharacterized cupin superfamily protein